MLHPPKERPVGGQFPPLKDLDTYVKLFFFSQLINKMALNSYIKVTR
jgi:hypothetical protein